MMPVRSITHETDTPPSPALHPWSALKWQGHSQTIVSDTAQMRASLLQINQPLWVVLSEGKIGLAPGGDLVSASSVQSQSLPILGMIPAVPWESLGDPAFRRAYHTRASFYAGAMAGAIASEDLVISLGKAGLMGSFGAGGCSPARIEAAISKIQEALPNGPYAFNLLNSPNEPRLEQRAAELYVQKNIPVVEASAYLDITYALAHYRLSGLELTPDGKIQINHRVIAKISRKEVASRFLSPAPDDLVNRLLEEKKITHQQAELSRYIPMADDITVEADSGGHTDNRPLIGLIPAIIALRDQMQSRFAYPQVVRVGAAGGIATPQAVLAAFTLGAAYVTTGSINQACVEAGTSEHTRNLLAQAEMADVAMAPSADMFEMGVKVQVLKRGTMFAPRASKLYEIYSRYNAWDEVPQTERDRLEKTIFKRTFEEIWADTVKFFTERDPSQLVRAEKDPHQKMALVFRWYLGLSSRWSNTGEKGREMDYQIWCGPSMGVFNEWVRGTYLEQPANRRIVDITLHLFTGAAYLSRIQAARLQGIFLPEDLNHYTPEHPLST